MNDYEEQRLATLRQLNLLDTPPSESFDRITRMASQLFDLPIAAVSLSDEDRQWFKSRVGVDHWEIPRCKACCGEVSDSSDMVVVNDLLESDHYRDSPLAQSGIRFYAGADLTTKEGYTLGAMCVLGNEPREVTEQERVSLRDLAAMVMAQIELQHAVGRVDAITGLPNYLQFVEDMDDLAKDDAGARFCALSTELVDLSQASSLQRVMGPSYLESLASAASQRLKSALGPDKKLYHIGPCQFAHLEVGDAGDILKRAKGLREALLTVSVDDTSPFMLRPVVGIAPFRAWRYTAAGPQCLAGCPRRGETGRSLFQNLRPQPPAAFRAAGEIPRCP
jgi:GGDEF domain-containing protein